MIKDSIIILEYHSISSKARMFHQDTNILCKEKSMYRFQPKEYHPASERSQRKNRIKRKKKSFQQIIWNRGVHCCCIIFLALPIFSNSNSNSNSSKNLVSSFTFIQHTNRNVWTRIPNNSNNDQRGGASSSRTFTSLDNERNVLRIQNRIRNSNPIRNSRRGKDASFVSWVMAGATDATDATDESSVVDNDNREGGRKQPTQKQEQSKAVPSTNADDDEVVSKKQNQTEPQNELQGKSTDNTTTNNNTKLQLSKTTSSSSSSSSSTSSPPDSLSTTTSMQIKSSIEKTTAAVGTHTNKDRNRRRKKYQRKRPKTQSEKRSDRLRQTRQKQYEDIMSNGSDGNIFEFESLFPAPKWDEATIHRDLFEVSERDASLMNEKRSDGSKLPTAQQEGDLFSKTSQNIIGQPKMNTNQAFNNTTTDSNIVVNTTKVNKPLTRMVEDRLYGFRRGQLGEFEYDTTLMGDGAVKFRDGVRLGNALKVNADRLTYFAKKEMIRGKLEEAEELYEQAIQISPRDGRPYLGLAKIAERRRDFKSAKDCLRAGIVKSRCEESNGANPFLLQALGNLEERMGHLSEAENLYIDAARSRPSHAAAWVSLAQLRTRKLRQGPNAGRVCYQRAEKELKKAGLPKSTYVYTAWAGLECKAGNIGTARRLFKKALEIDPKCSAAWLQLGVMEANVENWEEAKEIFETVLKFDKRNSRVLQAYALMETKRPDGDSRDAIGLFEKALRAKPRDGGTLQAYALYVAKLGDIDSARDL